MIKILPVTEEAKLKELCKSHEGASAFCVYDGEETKGVCIYTMNLEEEKINILEFSSENSFYSNLLIRAVFNAADLKGVRRAEFSENSQKAAGEVVDCEKYLTHDIQELFFGCKNCL